MSQSQAREIIVTTIARKVSVPIADEDARSETKKMRFINEILPGEVAKDFENQAINGDGRSTNNNLEGLFFRPAEPSAESDKYTDPHYKLIYERTDENLVEFCLGALAKYRRPWPDGAGREPTHIILPVGSWEQLLEQKKRSGNQPLASDLDRLWNLPILASDFVPEGRGLVLAIDDIALVLADGLHWEFGQRPEGIEQGFSITSVTHNANLLIKHPQSIMLLDGLEAAQEEGRSREAPEMIELMPINLPLGLREMFFNRSRDILRYSEVDKEGRLDLSPVSIDNAGEVRNELQSNYAEIWAIDRFVEEKGNENEFAFKEPDWEKDEEVRKLIKSWLERFPREQFIFRGQSDRWQVTSTLYRSLLRVDKESCLSSMEKRVLTAARYVNLPHTPETEIFADLQHFGGMTNYIDFTTYFTVALYFACKGKPGRDGEIFIVNRNQFSATYPIGQTSEGRQDSNLEYEAIAMTFTSLNFQRAAAQQGLFIRSEKGYIESSKFDRVESLGEKETTDFMVLAIKAEDKKDIMDYMRRTGAREELIFFEDTIGIIERDRRFEKPRATNEDILLKIDQYDNMEKEIQRQRASDQHRPAGELPKVSPHYYIGRIQYSRGCYEEAKSEFREAKRNDRSKEIPLQLDFYLASTYVRLEDCQGALKQLANVTGEACNHLYHFIAADAHFQLRDYRRAWNNIKKAVTMNQASLTYLRLKILIADKLNYSDEIENCTYTYLSHCAYDPEIAGLRKKYGFPEIKHG